MNLRDGWKRDAPPWEDFDETQMGALWISNNLFLLTFKYINLEANKTSAEQVLSPSNIIKYSKSKSPYYSILLFPPIPYVWNHPASSRWGRGLIGAWPGLILRLVSLLISTLADQFLMIINSFLPRHSGAHSQSVKGCQLVDICLKLVCLSFSNPTWVLLLFSILPLWRLARLAILLWQSCHHPELLKTEL